MRQMLIPKLRTHSQNKFLQVMITMLGPNPDGLVTQAQLKLWMNQMAEFG